MPKPDQFITVVTCPPNVDELELPYGKKIKIPMLLTMQRCSEVYRMVFGRILNLQFFALTAALTRLLVGNQSNLYAASPLFLLPSPNA
jgi:hypothetical protein